ncbi:hypothetical protein ACFOSC_14890 [Streptantibioticus rubrisoli]|uniref:Uncharacterized protein n=1 Tax=Streptantibioticus rubrisoli TaxID=1387313 RepID=A0ABT1P9N2_9ACTN|nr:hypothetical protein [Streptantibioticus rubrisoli]MCQ4042066.1 hypothetical protein [Streptantibioticus rubrisoli]
MATPTPGFVNSLASWAWLERTSAGPVAFLLLAHPDARAVERELTGLAKALGLVPPCTRVPDTGARVTLVGPGRAVVQLDGCAHRVQVEVGERWSAFVGGGGPVLLLVGLDPLARCSPRERVEEYLGVSTLGGRLRLGAARVR